MLMIFLETEDLTELTSDSTCFPIPTKQAIRLVALLPLLDYQRVALLSLHWAQSLC